MTQTGGGSWTTTPIGGQAQSARCSEVFFLPPDCTAGIKLDGLTPPAGVRQWFSEQVTRIEIRSMVANKKYGHDKSFCAQDTCKGIASWNGSLQTKVQCVTPVFSFQAGSLMWLSIYPLGTHNGGSGNGVVIEGYAEIEEDPIIMTLESGDPVEHNYTFASKGWWNIPQGVSGTFDCCTCCGTVGGSTSDPREGGSTFALPERVGGLTQKPVTVYQWSDKGEWVVSYDEGKGQFMPGPMPQESGRFVGEMRFIPCVAG